MADVSPDFRQNEHVAAKDQEQQRDMFFSGLLQEAFNSIFAGSRRDSVMNAANNPLGASNLIPDMSILNQNQNIERSAYQVPIPGFDPYVYGGDIGGQRNAPPSQNADFDPSVSGGDMVGQRNAPPSQTDLDPNANAGDTASQRNAPPSQNPEFDPYAFGGDTGSPRNAPPTQNPDFDPYSYGGDTREQQNVPPFDPQPNKLPPDAPPQPNDPPPTPPAPDVPSPEGDQQTKMGDRMFTVHPDGSAEYKVAKGDCVWYVATDVLEARTGQKPDDAHIVAEVNAIAKASGLTQHGRNPDLIYPNDELIIPAAEKN